MILAYKENYNLAVETILRIPTDIEKSMKLKGNENVLISKIGKNKLLVKIWS